MRKLMIVATVMLSVLLITSCGEEETQDLTTPQDLTTLNTYLVEQDLDLTDMLDGWIITAEAVHNDLDSYYVIDTRSEDAYNAGHIPGAVFADATTLLDVAADNGGKTILVHCYKGIGAARYLVALRLSGYTDAKSLKFGMSAWGLSDADDGAVYDKWTGATSDIALDYPEDWLTSFTDPAEDVVYDYPVIATEEVEDGAAL
ncbi:MAG: rhodanese-like domain-containing protein, partial [Candidatus Marinimicrobia bacterium]|nr:rhodanese-like domain-containing protein [Candidatus Neomarinimicrobiota bacterium]